MFKYLETKINNLSIFPNIAQIRTFQEFNKKINDKIKEAKAQIDKNKYYMELIDNKISKIIKLPIVFAGKEPYITLINND